LFCFAPELVFQYLWPGHVPYHKVEPKTAASVYTNLIVQYLPISAFISFTVHQLFVLFVLFVYYSQLHCNISIHHRLCVRQPQCTLQSQCS
jgi:hypothetical protein